MSATLNFGSEQLSSMELYSLQLQKAVADFTDFDSVTKAYVDDKVLQAKQELTDGASSALDTFRELEDYLTTSGVAGGLVEQIAALSASIASEIARAEGAESSLQASLEDEVSRATGVENALQSEVDTTQVALGTNAVGQYQQSQASNYIASATSFKSADELLDAQIKVNELAVVAEEERAAAAETALQASINTLSTQQSGDNSTVEASLTAEIVRATDRENQIQGEVADEIKRATAAEATIQTALDAQTTKQASDKATADADRTRLQEELDIQESKQGTEHQANVDRLDGHDGDISGLNANIESETSRAEDAEGALQTELDNQKTKQDDQHSDNAMRLDTHDNDIQVLQDRPHDGANGGFGIQHVAGGSDNKYIYFSTKWRLHGSSDGTRLVFEYNKGDDVTPNFVSAVPFISHA